MSIHHSKQNIMSSGEEGKIPYKIETGMGPITDKVITDLIEKFSTEGYRDKIIELITQTLNQKIRPYLYVTTFLFVIILTLILFIIYILLSKRCK